MTIVNGDKVNILESGVIGTVIGVCIRGVENQTFEYEVSWFAGGQLYSKWVWSFQLEKHVDTTTQAGLVNYEDNGVKRLN